MWKPPWREKTWSTHPGCIDGTHGVCSQWVYVCGKFQLRSSLSSYASFGVVSVFLCHCVFVCLNAFVCIVLCKCPRAHVFVRVGECKFTGWAHLWSRAVVDSKVLSLSSESLSLAFISYPPLVASCRPKHDTGVLPPLSSSKTYFSPFPSVWKSFTLTCSQISS